MTFDLACACLQAASRVHPFRCRCFLRCTCMGARNSTSMCICVLCTGRGFGVVLGHNFGTSMGDADAPAPLIRACARLGVAGNGRHAPPALQVNWGFDMWPKLSCTGSNLLSQCHSQFGGFTREKQFKFNSRISDLDLFLDFPEKITCHSSSINQPFVVLLRCRYPSLKAIPYRS